MVNMSEAGTTKKPKDHYGAWVENYFRVRAFTNFLFDKFYYKADVEGDLPKEGPRVLVLPHQNSLDGLSLMRGIDEYIAFVYSTYEIGKDIALRLIPYHIGGIRIKKSYVYFQRLFKHLDRNSLVVIFPQGRFEEDHVSAFSLGIAELVQAYEQRRGRKVTIIPAGIEYQFPEHLPKRAPVPLFKFPFPGTRAIIRFGSTENLDGRNSKELTEIVMQEAARLSKLNYVVA